MPPIIMFSITTRDKLEKEAKRIRNMVEISKADWKLFRERVTEWQEHYMERLTKDYIELLSSPGYASVHFWKLDKRIKSDKKHSGVVLEINKSEMLLFHNRSSHKKLSSKG